MWSCPIPASSERLACCLATFLAVAAAVATAAEPRTGTVYFIELQTTGPRDVQTLARKGFDIDSRHGHSLRLFATPSEVDDLRKSGYTVSLLPTPVIPHEAGALPNPDTYHTYEEITSFLVACTSDYPAVCALASIGTSGQGRELWAMRLTADRDQETDKPEVKIIGAIHGNEPVAMEMCLRLINDLLEGWSTNHARLTNMLASTDLWVLPLLNPDGWSTNPPSRYNAGGYDLNRSFPEGSYQNIGNRLYGPGLATNGLQPEVLRVMQWVTNHNFVLAASLHAGSLVVNYPYDSNEELLNVDSPTPDDALLRELALSYTVHNTSMWNSTSFTNGIVNGAAWYPMDGGMQDWNYRYAGCSEFTIEVWTNKIPPATSLDAIWQEHRESMWSFIEAAHRGLRGVITDDTGSPVQASMEIDRVHHLVFSDRVSGGYQRLLQTGTYDLVVSAPGFQTRVVTNMIVTTTTVTRVNVVLERTNRFFSARINFQPGSAVTPEGYRADTGGVYAAADGGLACGWNTATGQTVATRDAGESQDLRFDSVCILPDHSTPAWEIAVPTGQYRVVVIAGDPRTSSNASYRFAIEGAAVMAGTPTPSHRWLRGEGTVAVVDGRLTVSVAEGTTNGRLCSLEIDRCLAPVEEWRASTFGAPDDVGDAANGADPDGDDSVNLLEYACGTDPATNTSTPSLRAMAGLPDTEHRMAIRFTRATDATDMAFSVVARDELAGSNTWASMARYSATEGWTGPAAEQDLVFEEASGAVMLTTVYDPNPLTSITQRFIRVVIQQQGLP